MSRQEHFQLIPAAHRAYLRSHPLAAWFAIAILISSAIALLFPETVAVTPAAVLLPDWLEDIFRWFYLIGGAAATYGILRGRANLEGAGWALVTSAILTQVVALLFLTRDPSIVVNAIVLAALGAGTGQRAWHLTFELPKLRAMIEDQTTREQDELL